MKPKYNITIRDLETKHNINKLERDGFTRSQIIDKMYKLTDGANTQDRNKIINNLYNRNEK